MTAFVSPALDWLLWVADHNLPAIVLALAMSAIVLLELRKPGP